MNHRKTVWLILLSRDSSVWIFHGAMEIGLIHTRVGLFLILAWKPNTFSENTELPTSLGEVSLYS